MKLTLRVDQGEGPYEISTNLAVIVAWERKYRRKASDLASGIGMEDLAYLAYEASKRKGIVVPIEFDKFIDKLVTLEVVSEEPENPTEQAPTDTP
jgi:hypothetical protein